MKAEWMTLACLASGLIFSSAQAASPTSHCAPSEKIYFTCETKQKKVISICGSTELSQAQSYLQYRYGKKGFVELEFPKERKGSTKTFFYAHHFRAQFDNTTLRFENKGVSYEIYRVYDGDSKPAVDIAGVAVTPAAKKRTEIACASLKKEAYTNELSALEGFASCDPDDAMNLGTCPPAK